MLYLELQSSDLNIKTGTGSIKRQYETCFFQNAHLPLLDAGVDAAKEPNSNKEGEQTTEDGERLTEGIHKGVVIGHLDIISTLPDYSQGKEELTTSCASRASSVRLSTSRVNVVRPRVSM